MSIQHHSYSQNRWRWPTWPSTGEQINETRSHPCSETLLGHEKEWSPDSRCNRDGSQKCCAEWMQGDTKGHILYDSIFMKCSEKTDLCRYRKQMSGCLGLVVGTRVECRWAHGNFGGNGNVLKLNCADGCTTLYIYQHHWIMSLEWVNFLVYKLYLNCFKKEMKMNFIN